MTCPEPGDCGHHIHAVDPALIPEPDDLAPEYDFSGGVQGKYVDRLEIAK